jgi:folate-binding protein YgfZ
MSTWQALVATESDGDPIFPACAITDLSHFGLIRLSGDDKRTFLQGQVTNDVNRVSAEQAQLNSYCSPKGRMLGSFWMFQRGEDLYLQMPADRLAPTLKRLSMYVLRSQVTISDASDELVRFGIAGDCAEQLLTDVPAENWGTLTRDAITVLRLPGDRPRFELIGPVESMTERWSEISAGAEVAGADFWALMDIRAGLPTVFDETAEAFVPQMANLQLLDGVSFTKGCYTGQEVVARMQYLGKLKRRMYRGHVVAGERPGRGTELFSPLSDSGQGTGRVVDVAPSPEGGFELLVVLQISVANANDLRLGGPDGPQVTLLPLPYEFEASED